MDDQEKLRAAINMLRKLKRMVGFFMKKEIAELIDQLEKTEFTQKSKNTVGNNPY